MLRNNHQDYFHLIGIYASFNSFRQYLKMSKSGHCRLHIQGKRRAILKDNCVIDNRDKVGQVPSLVNFHCKDSSNDEFYGKTIHRAAKEHHSNFQTNIRIYKLVSDTYQCT